MKKYTYILLIALFATSYNTVAQTISFNYDADGNMESRYVVELQNARQKMAEEQTEEIAPEIASAELAGQKITVYPNPTHGEICVEISPLQQEREDFIRLFDVSGQLITTRKITSEHTYLEITGKPGVYLLDIHLGKNISKWKIIKQ